MKIKFNAHQQTEREVELSQQQLFLLFEIMRLELLEHITYSRFESDYQTDVNKSIIMFCNKNGVDVEYKKDRVAFFEAIFKELRNPYQ
jgi:hypothetical protein